jgi:purine nucleoside phosphorylase
MEQHIPYVSICSVDNYCNGIGRKPLTVAQMATNTKKSMQTFERLVKALVQENGP